MAVMLLVEQVHRFVESVTIETAACITNNGEKPRPSVPPGKRPEVTKRAQRCFLHNVLRVVIVAHEPSRQTIASIEMWQNDFVEFLAGH